MMREENHPDLYAALLVGLFANALLRTQAAYYPRAGLTAALLCVPLLAGVGHLFAACWHLGQSPLLRVAFAGLLLYASALEVLRLWRLLGRLYPDTLGLTAVCLVVLLPVIYLRRVSAVAQTARVLLCLLAGVGALTLVSVLPRLHLTNLQVTALQGGDLRQAAAAQLALSPEYLLPALWPQPQKHRRCRVLRLSAAAVGFDVGIHLLLQLFYGAALPLRSDPLHAAARCGAISVFNRLEWLQLLLWVMAVTLKLALYLYAMVRLLGLRGVGENTAAGLGGFPLYFGLLWALCAFLSRTDPDAARRLCNQLFWGFAGLVWMGGAAAWLCKSIRRRCAG